MGFASIYSQGEAVQALADAGNGRALRAMIREYTEIAIDELSESNSTAALTALFVACMAREALRHAENEGTIARLPDTLTPEEIEGIAL